MSAGWWTLILGYLVRTGYVLGCMNNAALSGRKLHGIIREYTTTCFFRFILWYLISLRIWKLRLLVYERCFGMEKHHIRDDWIGIYWLWLLLVLLRYPEFLVGFFNPLRSFHLGNVGLFWRQDLQSNKSQHDERETVVTSCKCLGS